MLILLVGAGRFERPTPCAQGRCATRLRYAPTFTALLILNHFPKFTSIPQPLLSLKTYQNCIKTPSLDLHRIKTLRPRWRAG